MSARAQTIQRGGADRCKLHTLEEVSAPEPRMHLGSGPATERLGGPRAGGAISYTVVAPLEDRRRHAVAPVEHRSRRQTLKEPAAGIMDRLRSGQS
jgi:hypothetical protein